MKRREILKSIAIANGAMLTGLTFSGSAFAASGPSAPSAPSAVSAPSAPSAPSAVSAPSRPSAPSAASAPSAPSEPSSPSAASLPSTASRPSGPDGYLDDLQALTEAERQDLLARIQNELNADGLQAVSTTDLDSVLAAFN